LRQQEKERGDRLVGGLGSSIAEKLVDERGGQNRVGIWFGGNQFRETASCQLYLYFSLSTSITLK